MNIIDRLDAEWPFVARSARMTNALQTWRQHEPALAYPSIAALVTAAEQRDQVKSDRILAALISRAPCDDCAARLVLQMLLPGAKAMLRTGRAPDQDERTAVVVAALFDRIRTYRIERRPERIAANVLMDVRHRLLRWNRARFPRHVNLHSLPDHMTPSIPPGPGPRDEAVSMLAWAVRTGHLDRGAARLIALTRLAGMSVAAVAAADGENEQTVRRRRLRAEERLRELAMA